MIDIEKAKKILAETASTCVLCRGDTVYKSNKAGISPMLGFIEEKIDLNGFSAADKIIGKAAALLFVSAGVSEVFGEVMSREALPVFEQYNVLYSFNTLTDKIINRNGDDICPMEMAVQDITLPEEAEKAIRGKLRELSRG